jgi:hypothetical protein
MGPCGCHSMDRVYIPAALPGAYEMRPSILFVRNAINPLDCCCEGAHEV